MPKKKKNNNVTNTIDKRFPNVHLTIAPSSIILTTQTLASRIEMQRPKKNRSIWQTQEPFEHG